jgi:hypothetical protein
MSETNELPKILGEDPDWGVDAMKEDRPGVPQESKGAATEDEVFPLVRKQTNEPAPFVGPNRHLTPVYSTDSPPRGLSGLMRRAAYQMPEYKARRWMLLLAADRVDVLEHANVGRAVVGASAFVFALSLVKILRASLAR